MRRHIVPDHLNRPEQVAVSNSMIRKANRNPLEGEVDLPPVPHVRLPNALAYAVALAVFAKDAGIEPRDAAQLVVLARRAFTAGAKGTDTRGLAREQRAGDRFEAKAHELGLAVEWPGLWPELLRGGVRLRLPDIGGD